MSSKQQSTFIPPALTAVALVSFLANRPDVVPPKGLLEPSPPSAEIQKQEPDVPKNVAGIDITPGSDFDRMLSDLANGPRTVQPRDHSN